MIEALETYLPVILPTLGTVCAALAAAIVAILKTVRIKAELQTANAELEKEKIELEKQIYSGSYVICPGCGRKIKLSEMEFLVDKKGGSEL